MKKEINIENSKEFETANIIMDSIKVLESIYYESDKVNSVHISIDYDPSTNETVTEVLDKIYRTFPAKDPSAFNRAMNMPNDLLSKEASIKVGMFMLLNHYSLKGWMTEAEFDEFARSFTVLYEIITKRKVEEYPLDWDEIGNFLTMSGMGYNVVGGFNIRKLYGGNPEKPYIIDKITERMI